VVLVNAAIDDLGFACVATDDRHAVDQANNHLASLGHRAIGLVLGPSDHVPSHRKQLAFEALVGDCAGLVERTIFSMEGGQAAATRLVKRGITGIICASDVLALGAMKAVRRLGLSVPADVSVVGFDDSGFMNCTDPPLTTVRQPIDAMGHAAVALLASQIAGNAVPTEEMLFEPELVVRGSTGPVAARDPGTRRASRSAAKATSRSHA
jgi:DNA-binding LacI/PurR family transcriptional regulator